MKLEIKQKAKQMKKAQMANSKNKFHSLLNFGIEYRQSQCLNMLRNMLMSEHASKLIDIF